MLLKQRVKYTPSIKRNKKVPKTFLKRSVVQKFKNYIRV